MFEWLKYRRKLNQLNRKIEEEEKTYKKELLEAKDEEEKQQLHAVASSAIVPIIEEVNCLQSNRLCHIANRLIVPIPKRQDETYWEFSRYTAGYYLTTEGINEVRKRIRRERKDRCDLVLMWIPAVVGVLGALIGLIAVYKN